MTTAIFKREQKTDKDNKEQYSYVSKDQLRGKKGRLGTGLRLFNYFVDEYGNIQVLVRHIPLKEKLEEIIGHETDKVEDYYKEERGYSKYYFNVSCEELEKFRLN